MLKFILSFIIFICASFPSFAQQYCIPGRFDSTYAFTSSQIEVVDNVSYGQNTDWQGNQQNLKFIIANPNFESDNLSKRPFILLIHGGGYVNGNRYEMAPVMMDFAQRGYVCASIDYRLGWDVTGDPFACMGNGYSLAQAVYRSMQDTKAAFRYFAANAGKYKIDTNCFFTGGISAGAVTSYLIVYASQENMNSYYPNLITELGPLNTATNNLTNPFTIKCILSSSGAINDTLLIKPSNTVPTLMFHGTADLNIPFIEGFTYTCNNYLRVFGPFYITRLMGKYSKAFELDYVIGGGHENFYPLDYLPKRSAIFLKRYLCNDARQVVINNYTVESDVVLESFNTVTPTDFTLYQNYPNPFNPSTTIKYYLPKDGKVSIKICDIRGRQIIELVNEIQSSGFHLLNYNASSLSSGVYFYSMNIESSGIKNSITKKMILIK